MPEIPVDHCPQVELIPLPSKTVITGDGQPIKLGTILYFRYAPGPAATEYVVVSDKAIRVKGGHKVILLGSQGIALGMNPLDFVKDKKEWWEFYLKRNPAQGSSNVRGK